MKKIAFFTAVFSALTLTACDDLKKESGNFSLDITDGPVDEASEIVISFTGVELEGPDLENPEDEPTTIMFDMAKNINLLEYQGTDSTPLLEDISLAQGEYESIRLLIDSDASYILINGAQQPLSLAVGSEDDLQINKTFNSGGGLQNNFTIDFDLRKSITLVDETNYQLTPSLRLVENSEVGSLEGTVEEDFVLDNNCDNGSNNDTGNAVYIFEGSDAAVQDIFGTSSQNPITTAKVTYNDTDEEYEFVVGFLEAGSYTVAFTCDARRDTPNIDEVEESIMEFSNGVNVTIGATDNNEVHITEETTSDSI